MNDRFRTILEIEVGKEREEQKTSKKRGSFNK
jgi:hypothetical protein